MPKEKRIKRRWLKTVWAMFLLHPLTAVAAGSESLDEGNIMAWLTLVDDGQYQQSWEDAGGFFRQQLKASEWQSALKQVRAPLGEPNRREIQDISYHDNLPGAPKGRYAVASITTDFAQKPAAIETVTLVEEDGQWRVVGYFIR